MTLDTWLGIIGIFISIVSLALGVKNSLKIRSKNKASSNHMNNSTIDQSTIGTVIKQGLDAEEALKISLRVAKSEVEKIEKQIKEYESKSVKIQDELKNYYSTIEMLQMKIESLPKFHVIKAGEPKPEIRNGDVLFEYK